MLVGVPGDPLGIGGGGPQVTAIATIQIQTKNIHPKGLAGLVIAETHSNLRSLFNQQHTFANQRGPVSISLAGGIRHSHSSRELVFIITAVAHITSEHKGARYCMRSI